MLKSGLIHERPPYMLLSATPISQAWDDYVLAHPRAHVLQLSAWGELKAGFGWQPERLALLDGRRIVGGAQVLFRRLPLRLGTIAYIPFGPLLDDEAHWPALRQALDVLCRRHRAAFLKLEPGFYLTEAAPTWSILGLRSSPQTIQPPRSIFIDLSGSEDGILARMNQGTRRKIRQALKAPLDFIQVSSAQVDDFAVLIAQTGARNAFGVHEAAYYQRAYNLLVPQHAALLVAYHRESRQALAGVFVAQAGQTAYYLYGASSDQQRELMASYGVQWQAMLWAKARGARWYDMWGIPDEDEAALEAQFQARSDGLWGVYGFKRGWGGQVVRSAAAWDRVYNPLLYAAYQQLMRRRTSD
ncbi:MAG: peptidoglycan bridge formation glycyltransferase FemA/FemB family protein [Anaerolineae bacterium]|nr:peptidoglycan bridge formation glycyltransferase FemA/FemB family protein [Anaerolineae bacterium]